MCKYCEEKDNQDYYYISFIAKDDHYIAYDKQDKKFKLFDYYDEYCSTIQYCPWCGRKLEVLEEEEDFSAEDEITRLDGRINHTNTKIGQLLDTINFLMEMLDRGQVNHNNIDIVKNKLKNIKDSLCHD